MCMSVIDSENLVVRGGPPLEMINLFYKRGPTSEKPQLIALEIIKLYSVKGGPPLEMINSH